MRISSRIYFSHFSILRKKKNMKTGIFVRFRIPLSLSFFLAGTALGTHVSLFLLPSLFVTPARFSPFFSTKESGTNWLTSTRMAPTCRGDRGVTAVSVTRLRGGSRGGRGESPKISRSGFSSVYRPPKSNLRDRHSPSRRATSVFN